MWTPQFIRAPRTAATRRKNEGRDKEGRKGKQVKEGRGQWKQKMKDVLSRSASWQTDPNRTHGQLGRAVGFPPPLYHIYHFLSQPNQLHKAPTLYLSLSQPLPQPSVHHTLHACGLYLYASSLPRFTSLQPWCCCVAVPLTLSSCDPFDANPPKEEHTGVVVDV